MDFFSFDLILFVIGIILVVAEFFIPGGVAGFLGLNAMLTSILLYFGVINSFPVALMVWLFSSLVMYLAARPVLTKYLGGDSTYKLADEDVDAIGCIVDVVEDVDTETNNGRIKYQGISWNAKAIENPIPKGSKAVLKYRENLTWIIDETDKYLE